jgi:nitroreductase
VWALLEPPSQHCRLSGIELLNTTSGVNIPEDCCPFGRRETAPMELHEAIRLRTMVRSFSPDPVDAHVVDCLLRGALRSPTAGNTGGTAWVALEGREQAARYWEVATDEAWRRANPARFEGLRRAPVVLLAYTCPAAYVARYAEPDKDDARLGAATEQWPVPYWYGDAAFGVMTVLLGAVDAGLGACILGSFRGEERLAVALGVPDGWRLFGGVALGRPDGKDHRSASLDRRPPAAAGRIHRGGW